MDEPTLNPEVHQQALRGLSAINGWSNSTGILWPPIKALAQRISNRPIRILDVATGAGDVIRRLYRRAQRGGVLLDLEARDISPVALEFAQEQAQREKVPIRFVPTDVLQEDLPADYDVVLSSLFLHHLTEEQAVLVLQKMKSATKHLLMINDLQRSVVGWYVARIATRLLSRSHIVHVDGPRSVECAFTPHEAKELAEKAGLENVMVTRHFPWRFRLLWNAS